MASTLWVSSTIVVFMVNYVVSPPPAYVVSTRPTVRLSDQEFEHIIKDEQGKTEKNQHPPPDEKTLVKFNYTFSNTIYHTNRFVLFIL